MKNKIGWCSMTFNPVWGCLNKCEYCYARKIAKRFGEKMSKVEFDPYFYFAHPEDIENSRIALSNRLRNFIPTFLYSQFDKKFPKKSQRIFVGSMSEIAHWEKGWMEKVLRKIKKYPQHTFIFLTKFPKVYYGEIFPENCWLGVTITKESDFEKNDEWWGWFFNEANITFLSFEPLLKPIPIEWIGYSNIDWVIIGAETGNRKDKVIPKKEWIEDIVNYCNIRNILIYLKDSLKEIYPVEIKEFPKEGK